MFSYTYDEETGGILLNSTPTVFSKEPRPVYASELTMFGFDAYWKYEQQDDVPYMWAESVDYWYRGKKVAKLKGGDLYHAPEIILLKDENNSVIEPEPNGLPLRTIDLDGMIEKNRALTDVLETSTVKKIIAVYEKYKNKLDIFHVAFSGGKDSAVLLDLVKKALPKKSFVVVFGDTGMEFPDTYQIVDQTEAACEAEGIPFYRSKSHFEPCESWKLFGPPSRSLRWCCSVHKSTPQTLKLREITGNKGYKGMDFVGVRKHESVARSEYEQENYGKKQKGQYSFNAILEWTSAEVWLYIYSNCIRINRAYIKGSTRAGCIFCPMATGRSHYVQRYMYREIVDSYVELIGSLIRDDDTTSYVQNGGFTSRRSGRDLINNQQLYHEETKGEQTYITIHGDKRVWDEWKKPLSTDGFEYKEIIDDGMVTLCVSPDENKLGKLKLLKMALKKAAYCVGCKVCETNCSSGAIDFSNGMIHIDNCIHCKKCFEIPGGCYAVESRKIPAEEKRKMSINCFDSHAPKQEWIERFFISHGAFMLEGALGPNQLKAFKRFVGDASMFDLKAKKTTPFYEAVSSFSYNDTQSWYLMLCELVYNNAQFSWYIRKLDIDMYYSKGKVEEMLDAEDCTKNDINFIIGAFKRICDLPYGFGSYQMNGRQLDGIVRTKGPTPDVRIVLYALYKFAEKCNDYREFTLSWLMNDSIDRDGISPTRIFGLEYEEMKSILMGLSAKYPDFIDAAFTNDLDVITIKERTSQEVLDLFKEEV